MSETPKWLEGIQTATDSRFLETHRCEENPLPDSVHVLRPDPVESGPEAWWDLVNVWRADEGDVQSGDADEVGELSSISRIGVKFCPFCGEELC